MKKLLVLPLLLLSFPALGMQGFRITPLVTCGDDCCSYTGEDLLKCRSGELIPDSQQKEVEEKQAELEKKQQELEEKQKEIEAKQKELEEQQAKIVEAQEKVISDEAIEKIVEKKVEEKVEKIMTEEISKAKEELGSKAIIFDGLVSIFKQKDQKTQEAVKNLLKVFTQSEDEYTRNIGIYFGYLVE